MRKMLMVGLGNPGSRYQNTYHNAGYLMVDFLVDKLAGAGEIEPRWTKHGKVFEYLEAPDTVFIKPLTYMNESGRAVREAMKKFTTEPEYLVVIHDDSDITIGDYKISFGRSSAGQKGVQSIIDQLDTNQFTRIRIGIRAADEIKRKKAGEFALTTITQRDRETLKALFLELDNRMSSKTNSLLPLAESPIKED